MENFNLVLIKTGEVINKVKTENKEQAIEYFAKIKNLPIDTLLNLYFVEVE